MKRPPKSLFVSLTLILFIGCAPQRGFYFSASKASPGHNREAQVQSAPLATDEPTANLPDEALPVDTLVSAASTHYTHTPFAAPVKAPSISEKVKLQARHADKLLSDEQVRPTQFQKKAKKKAKVKVASERPVHTLSWVGFGLSMAGLILLIITLAVSGSLLLFALSFLSFLAALITSRNAISQIKKNPEQFSGKGLARAGFIISLIMLLLGVAFILYVLAFAGAF